MNSGDSSSTVPGASASSGGGGGEDEAKLTVAQLLRMEQMKKRAEKQKELREAQEDENHEDLLSYSAYRPVKLKFGMPHPDPVVENASLAAVAPPDITCEFGLDLRAASHHLLHRCSLLTLLG